MTTTVTMPPCAPWCAYQDDPDFFGGEEGTCLSIELRTPLSLEQPGDPGDYEIEGHDFVNVYAARRPGQPDAVFIGHNHLPGLEFTAEEARQLVEHVQFVLGQIEAAR